MLALVINNESIKPSLKNVQIPIIKDDEILIKVKKAGICGTDIPIFDGIREVKNNHIPGHEFSGVVVKIGKDVKKVKLKDRVTAGLVINCGKCKFCRKGLDSLCEDLEEIGISKNGAFAEYVKVPERIIHKLPVNLTFEEGASLDPLASAYRIIKKADIKKTDTVGIFGSGPIGLYSVQLVKILGAKKVISIGTENDKFKLKLAKELGADDVLINDKNITSKIKKINNNEYLDVAVEATGNPDVLQTCINSVEKNGRISLGGIFHRKTELYIEKIVSRELEIKGSFCYNNEDFRSVINLVEDKKINTDKLISHRLKLEEINKGIELIKQKKAIKIMINI
jgi:2-desacetyl-2-hydroxyethyl bacteriochlorophyllide A dehydrogenase